MNYKLAKARIASLLIVLVLAAAPAWAANRGIFIGTAKYTQPGCSPLPDTRFDANDMFNTTIREGMLTEADARLVIGRNRKTDILRAIEAQGKGMGPEDTFYVYNSSHGSSSGQLCASDADISPAEMAAALSKSGCGNVVIINDSCHSEGFKVSVPGKKVAQVNAAGKDNVAYSSTTPVDGMGHKNGVLTKYVMDGFTDGAADINGDGHITSRELAAWVRTGVKHCEKDHPGTHDYDNNITGQSPNATGDDVTLSSEGPGREFKGQRLVPNVIGQKAGVAIANIKRDDLKYALSKYRIKPKEWLSSDWAGCILTQVPKAGTRVDPDFSVDIEYVLEKVVSVPTVTSRKVAEATATIEGVKLHAWVKNPGHAEDNVGFQYPNAGTEVIRGSHVRLSKSDLAEVAIPFIIGQDEATARKRLEAVGLQGNFVTDKPNDYNTHPPFKWTGKAWQCNPDAGQYVPAKSAVTVTVAPDNPVDVPYLKGMSMAVATEALRKANIKFGLGAAAFQRQTTDNPEGVHAWSPQPQAFRGDTIWVGVEFPEVPDLSGLTEEEAKAACAKARLKLRLTKKDIPTAADFNQVAQQMPASGARARRNDVVKGLIPLRVASVHVSVKGKESDKSVSRASLSLEGPKSLNAVAATGKHTFSRVIKGEYNLSAKRKGFKPASMTFSVDPETALARSVVLALEIDETPMEVLHVNTADHKRKPARCFPRKSKFFGIASHKGIPAGATIGKVSWILATPGGKRIRSKVDRNGQAGLTASIRSTEKWPFGDYGIMAVAYTDEGVYSGQCKFTIEEPPYLNAPIKTPCYTGQWTRVGKIKGLPFSVGGDLANVKLKGINAFLAPHYWRLEGNKIFYRPIRSGAQRPAFALIYKGEEAKCGDSVTVKLTMLPVTLGKENKTIFSLSVPASFVPPFRLYVRPYGTMVITQSPRRSRAGKGRPYSVEGRVLSEKVPEGVKKLRVKLIDQTQAEAGAVIQAECKGKVIITTIIPRKKCNDNCP